MSIQKDNKLTFEMIFKDFKMRHPNMAKDVVHWRPNNYMEIRIFLDDGMILRYNYWDHKATICKENWRRDHLSLTE